MKKTRLIGLALGFLLLLAACTTTTTPNATELFDELEGYSNADGDVEFSSSVTASALAGKPVGNIMFETFTTTSPNGKSIEGWVVFEGNDESLFSTTTEYRFRGKLSSIQGKKVFSGFLIDKDRNSFPFLAYKAGTEFDTSFDGKSVGNTLLANAEIAKADDRPTEIVARTRDSVWLSVTSEEVAFSDGVSKDAVTLELTAQIEGFIGLGEALLTFSDSSKVTLPVVGFGSWTTATGTIQGE